MEYKEIGLGTIALLESEKDGVGEILRKLSETLKKNIWFLQKLSQISKTLQETLRNATAMEFYFRRRFFMPNFAVANKLQRRVKAAVQHSSSDLGSAFTLHFTCTRKSDDSRLIKFK